MVTNGPPGCSPTGEFTRRHLNTEIQTYTDSTANLSQDGAGNLKITPIKDGSGEWTSARIETVRKNFEPATVCPHPTRQPPCARKSLYAICNMAD